MITSKYFPGKIRQFRKISKKFARIEKMEKFDYLKVNLLHLSGLYKTRESFHSFLKDSFIKF